jgi:hypothetical protein
MTNDFDKFTNLNEDIDDFINQISKIEWFVSCGDNYSKKLGYDYMLEENIEIAKKNITRTNNYAGVITIENLFQEASHRTYSFFHNNNQINLTLNNLELNSWCNLRKKILVKLNELDLSNIDKKYNQKFEFKKPVDSFVFDLLLLAIMEKYCKRIFPEIPTFYEKIMPVYIDGHIITGWKGKFPSPYLFVDKPIDSKKGKLVIW